MEKGNFCIGLFMDLSKAFDTIDHHIVLNKLSIMHGFGVLRSNGSVVIYTKGHKMWWSMVLNPLYNVTIVEFHRVLCWVLFSSLSIINDVVNSSNLFRFSLYADDTVATLSGKNLQIMVSSVNREISNISLLFRVNKLPLNQSKTNKENQNKEEKGTHGFTWNINWWCYN